MAELLIGKILGNSVKHDYGKTFFYFLHGKEKVLVILNEGVELPEDFEGKFEIYGQLRYSFKKKILKMYADEIKKQDEGIDYREELRQMILKMKQGVS